MLSILSMRSYSGLRSGIDDGMVRSRVVNRSPSTGENLLAASVASRSHCIASLSHVVNASPERAAEQVNLQRLKIEDGEEVGTPASSLYL